MKTGPLAGYPIQDIKVTLLDGAYHDVDSDSLSFELAAKIAFREAAQHAKPVFMEPIMNMEIEVLAAANEDGAEAAIGAVISSLSSRRSNIKSVESQSSFQVIKANTPLSELHSYVTTLRTITSGKASPTMTFSHYEQVKEHVAEKIIEAFQQNKVKKS